MAKKLTKATTRNAVKKTAKFKISYPILHEWTDEEWNIISPLFGSAEQREKIQTDISKAILFYKTGAHVAQEEGNKTNILDDLEAMKGYLKKFNKKLSQPKITAILRDPSITKQNDSSPSPPSYRWALRWPSNKTYKDHLGWLAPKAAAEIFDPVQPMQEEINGFLKHINKAILQIDNSEKWGKTAEADALVKRLDEILFGYTGINLTRSKVFKEKHIRFVETIFKIVGKEDGAEDAIKRLTKSKK